MLEPLKKADSIKGLVINRIRLNDKKLNKYFLI